MIAVDTLLELDNIPVAERSLAAAALRVCLRILAEFLPILVPAATFSAAFLCVAQGARAREIIALKAGGVNPLLALAPILAAALAIGIASTLVQETAGIRAAAVLAEQAGTRRGEPTRSGVIWFQSGRVLYSARESDAEGERVADIHVLERNDQGRLVRQIQAERALRLSSQQWRFEQAVVRSFDPSAPTQPPRFERAEAVTLELATDRAPRLDSDELAALPLPMLGDYVSSVLAADGSPGPARWAFHQRASAPALALLFALLALPLAMATESDNAPARHALQGVLWIALFLFLRIGVGDLASAGGSAAVWLPWATLGAFLAFVSVRLARTPR